jgi:ribonuclease VapC
VSDIVLDSSALLAGLFAEDGAHIVAAKGPAAIMSAVNYSEVLTKSVDRGASLPEAEGLLAAFSLVVVPFDSEQAAVAASLRQATRAFGLSLGDRACLALGLTRKVAVLTADCGWLGLKIGVRIELIR